LSFRYRQELFRTSDAEFPLDPSFEPTDASRNEANMQIFSHLQQFRAARLAVPVGEDLVFRDYESKELQADTARPLLLAAG
jgi:hypothetical protein